VSNRAHRRIVSLYILGNTESSVLPALNSSFIVPLRPGCRPGYLEPLRNASIEKTGRRFFKTVQGRLLTNRCGHFPESKRDRHVGK
jgi:hypothetical protein